MHVQYYCQSVSDRQINLTAGTFRSIGQLLLTVGQLLFTVGQYFTVDTMSCHAGSASYSTSASVLLVSSLA